MSDPDVEQEIEANEARSKEGERDEQDGGILGGMERVFSIFRNDDVDPEDPDDIEGRRRANDEAAR